MKLIAKDGDLLFCPECGNKTTIGYVYEEDRLVGTKIFCPVCEGE